MTFTAVRTTSIRAAAVAVLLACGLTMAVPVRAEICCDCYYPSDPKASVCITSATAGDCENMPGNSTNSDVKSLTCKPSVMDVASATCKAISGGGICSKGPFDERTYKAPVTPKVEDTKAAQTLTAPTLAIPIPGLTFTKNIPVEGPDINVPWFAEYIAGAYRYLTSIVVIAAAVMIVYGGFKYIVSSSGAGVQTGKDVIKDAIIGLLLVIGAYTILWTINPATTSFGPLQLTRVKPDVNSYMSGREDAKQTMKEVGIEPGTPAGTAAGGATAGGATYSGSFEAGKNHVIPTACDGRDSAWLESPVANQFEKIGSEKVMKRNYTISCKGRKLDQKVIDFYIAEQKRTGVPAAVIMAQMVTEAGACSVFNLADGGPSSIFYNYGGIGCTQRMVPKGACAHVAFTKQAYELGASKTPHPLTCDVHNSSRDMDSAVCTAACEAGNRGQDCGPDCFALPSHASTIKDGKEIWMPSIQCSRKFKTPQEFLDSHLGFVRFCLPFNDSVYKFAYCIGASSYAGVTGGKGMAIAMIIERNCLCDPSTDSLGCKRNKELEVNLAKNIIKKRNLYLDVGPGYQPDFDKIVAGLAESTKGMLTPGSINPVNDLFMKSE